MSYLFDTNIFLRLTNNADPARALAVEALRTLRRRREALCFRPQVLAEFWNVCTRPPSACGGFGLVPSYAERRAWVEDFIRYSDITVVTPQHVIQT